MRRADTRTGGGRLPEAVAAVGLCLLAAPLNGRAGDVPQLEDLVAEALSRHPELKCVRHAARAQWEVPSQVVSPPDPWFTVQAQNIRFDEPGLDTSPMSAIQFGIVQPLPYPGKLDKRHDAAVATAHATDREVELMPG
jgi:hypothetical protein